MRVREDKEARQGSERPDGCNQNTPRVPQRRGGREGRRKRTGSSFSSVSPTPINLIGLPLTPRTERAAPPRVSPSSLVRMAPGGRRGGGREGRKGRSEESDKVRRREAGREGGRGSTYLSSQSRH